MTAEELDRLEAKMDTARVIVMLLCAKAWIEGGDWNKLSDAHIAVGSPCPTTGHPWWRTKWELAPGDCDEWRAAHAWLCQKLREIAKPAPGFDWRALQEGLHAQYGEEVGRLFPGNFTPGADHEVLGALILGLLGLLELPSVPL